MNNKTYYCIYCCKDLNINSSKTHQDKDTGYYCHKKCMIFIVVMFIIYIYGLFCIIGNIANLIINRLL
jgi:hypothetical protein